MPDGDGVLGAVRVRPARRWPMALAVVALALLLAGTSLSFIQDRQNASAATGSPSNAQRDALALASATTLVHAFDLDASLRRSGVVGLRAIVIQDFESYVVAPLGGVIENGRHQWSLALDGGWACLTWMTAPNEGEVLARRGVCNDDTPLVATQIVRVQAFDRAEQYVGAREQAVVQAAIAAGAMSSSVGGENRFSLPGLVEYFNGLAHTSFRSFATVDGLTVQTAHAAACLQPSTSEAQVRITLGACL